MEIRYSVTDADGMSIYYNDDIGNGVLFGYAVDEDTILTSAGRKDPADFGLTVTAVS